MHSILYSRTPDVMQDEDIKTTPPVVMDGNRKIFNDPVHGSIEVHPLCVMIIDTPQFQRLRDIKQLGGVYFVFPGAAHNRFEHSIGTSHLAGQFGRSLKDRQPELEITDTDILCLEIAGLCHDLGHGPFSHIFDRMFMPKVCKETKWKNEQASREMFFHLIKENKLEKEFKEHRLGAKDINFITALIDKPTEETEQNPTGRSSKKSFLYQIVANKSTGIDVDKWDYLARDCHMLGIKNSFDHTRLMKFARVLETDEGKMEICFRDKEASTLYNMFDTRRNLHYRAYQHKVSNIIELMIVDALVAANEHITRSGKLSQPCKMSECLEDMEAFTKLTDSVLRDIELNESSELDKSRKIIGKIRRRELYRLAGESLPSKKELRSEEVKAGMMKAGTTLTDEDFEVMVVKFDYGKDDKNPVDYVWFYSKSGHPEAIKLQKDEVSNMLPQQFSERVLRVVCKNDEKEDETSRCFRRWCKQRAIRVKGENVSS